MTSPSVATKTCTKCGDTLLATAEYFYRDKKGKYGLVAVCKQCKKPYQYEYRQKNKDKAAEYHLEYYQTNSDKIKARSREYYQANLKKVAEYRQKNAARIAEISHEYRQKNAAKIAETTRKYRQENKAKVVEWGREWRKNNKEKRDEYQREYRQKNVDSIAEQKREYRQNNLVKSRIAESRRRARKRNLPDTFTHDQWLECLEYFNHCCAVCERQLNDLFGEHKAAMDHWKPLSSKECTGTVPENIVPLCHGIDGCNNSKGSKLPDQWLKDTYGIRKAKAILKRIDDYFEWSDE